MPYKGRWTPEDKIRIVLESLNTNISMWELCRSTISLRGHSTSGETNSSREESRALGCSKGSCQGEGRRE